MGARLPTEWVPSGCSVLIRANRPSAIAKKWSPSTLLPTSVIRCCRANRSDGSPTPDGVGAIRVLGVDPSKPAKCNREEVVAFDAPSHFGYSLLSGQPIGWEPDSRRSGCHQGARC